ERCGPKVIPWQGQRSSFTHSKTTLVAINLSINHQYFFEAPRRNMKRFTLYLPVLLLTLLFTGVLPNSASAQCGVERWSVKTGSDPDAGLVNLNASSPTFISNLTALTAPNPIPANNRVAPTETTLWVLTATLTKYKREGDSDYHLVLDDGAGHTMIAEIPSPGCVAPGSPFAAGISHARAQFDACFTATSSFQTTSTPVQITGVGMFDFLHGQTGVAPNGIELHPVIDIIFNPSPGDFTIAAAPTSLSVAQGNAGTTTISTAGAGSFNSAISFSASGLPTGTNASFNPATIAAPGSGSSTLTLAVGGATTAGIYPVTVTGTGGGITHTSTLALTVTASSITQQLLGNRGFENGSANPAPWTATAAVIDSSTAEAAHSGAWKAWLD